jgi:two-component system capsular synthesis sensor histidine kinase RcsC
VLIVDDIEMNRDLLELQLATFGCRSTKAGGGHEALACLESAEFDLVLLDCQMPEMDGYEVARAARARWPARSLHIIAVTAHAQSDERARCLEAGMDDYVSKPLAMATLARVLREAHALALQSPRDRASG